MKISSLIFCLCCLTAAFAQHPPSNVTTGEQYLFSITDSVNGLVTLLHSGEYCMDLAYRPYDPYSSDLFNGDVTFMSYLSYGDYTRGKNGIIVFKDRAFGHRTEAILSDSSITFQSSDFAFLRHRPQTACKKLSGQEITLPPLPTKQQYISVLTEHQKSPDTLQLHTNGRYQIGEYYELILKNNHTYQWRLFSLPISQGNWEKVGNVLNFYDINTKQSYHALIKSAEQIKCIFMPSDYYKSTLQFTP